MKYYAGRKNRGFADTMNLVFNSDQTNIKDVFDILLDIKCINEDLMQIAQEIGLDSSLTCKM